MSRKGGQKVLGPSLFRILLKAKELTNLPPKFLRRPPFFAVVLNAYRAVALAQTVAIRTVPQGGMLDLRSGLS
ncbi:MAG: hypothetical protein EBZ31_01460 [Flavobacteriia bacterium]|nr:hypothetical protein [Flavobacteriia bacterium]